MQDFHGKKQEVPSFLVQQSHCEEKIPFFITEIKLIKKI